jgi:hypothetical protein
MLVSKERGSKYLVSASEITTSYTHQCGSEETNRMTYPNTTHDETNTNQEENIENESFGYVHDNK